MFSKQILNTTMPPKRSPVSVSASASASATKRKLKKEEESVEEEEEEISQKTKKAKLTTNPKKKEAKKKEPAKKKTAVATKKSSKKEESSESEKEEDEKEEEKSEKEEEESSEKEEEGSEEEGSGKEKGSQKEEGDEEEVDYDALIKRYSESKPTLDACREFIKEAGIRNISKDALADIRNVKDPEFTYRLIAGSLIICKAAKFETLMTRFTKAAVIVYDQLAQDLATNNKIVTKAAMRKYAKEQGVPQTSPKSIDYIFDKKDPAISNAKWGAAVALYLSKAFSATGKTLTIEIAETADELFECFKDVFVYCQSGEVSGDDEDEEEGEEED